MDMDIPYEANKSKTKDINANIHDDLISRSFKTARFWRSCSKTATIFFSAYVFRGDFKISHLMRLWMEYNALRLQETEMGTTDFKMHVICLNG